MVRFCVDGELYENKNAGGHAGRKTVGLRSAVFLDVEFGRSVANCRALRTISPCPPRKCLWTTSVCTRATKPAVTVAGFYQAATERQRASSAKMQTDSDWFKPF